MKATLTIKKLQRKYKVELGHAKPFYRSLARAICKDNLALQEEVIEYLSRGYYFANRPYENELVTIS